MALIGTISGSVGAGGALTSTTAISGTLVIADSPAAGFPTLTTGVKLFVSGNKTTLGADTPNSIFGGDTFVSGAFGTDSYIQMKPVGVLRIPTNTTASYIYTSGSTNDLYFTQYQPGTGYTNTTRLRWLEGSLSTGLLHGGVLSTENGTTTFSITSGSGIIIDYNASTVDEPFPTIVQVDWPAYVSSSLPNIASAEITYIAIDSTGALFKQNTAYTDGDFEDKIIIGRVLHQNGSVTNGTITSPTVAYGQTGFRGDFIRAFGPLKLSGHVVSVNATATNPPTNTEFLGLAKTAGDSYVEGRNYTTNANSPNYIKSTTDTALTTSKIYREYVNASGVPVIDTGTGTAGYTEIDPDYYNNAGSKDLVPTGNRFTVQRLYWFPNSVNRAIFAYYGSAVYNTIEAAEAGIATEAFVEGDNTRDAAIFLGYLIVKQGTTNLNTSTDAKLIQAGLSRAVAGSGGGGATSPGGSDTYVQYNDGGSFNGASELRFIESTGTVLAANLFVTGTTAGSLVSSGTFQVKNSGGTVVGSISTDGDIAGSRDLQMTGNITGSNALVNGDLAVNGGDITTTASTFNLITGSATTVNFAESATLISIGSSAASSVTKINNVVTASSGKIALTNAAGSLLTFPVGAGAVSRPTLTTNPAAGTKIVFYPNGSPTSTDFAMGIESFGMWQSVPTATTAYKFRWYGGSTEVASLRGDGVLTVTGSISSTSGEYIGGPGTGANSMTLVSSGNIVARLDTDDSAPGHRFAIVDNKNIDQFTVYENGNAEVSGTLVVSGSSISTTTTTTFNLLNSTLTGTLNVGSAATLMFFGSATSTGSFAGDLGVTGRTGLAGVVERLFHSQSAGGGVSTFDMINQSIFYVNNPVSNITANFNNVPLTPDFRVHTPTVILSQSAAGTARIVSAVQVNGSTQTINWANNVTPTGNLGKQDIFGFSLIRSGSAWKVLGQMSTYG